VQVVQRDKTLTDVSSHVTLSRDICVILSEPNSHYIGRLMSNLRILSQSHIPSFCSGCLLLWSWYDLWVFIFIFVWYFACFVPFIVYFCFYCMCVLHCCLLA